MDRNMDATLDEICSHTAQYRGIDIEVACVEGQPCLVYRVPALGYTFDTYADAVAAIDGLNTPSL